MLALSMLVYVIIFEMNDYTQQTHSVVYAFVTDVSAFFIVDLDCIA